MTTPREEVIQKTNALCDARFGGDILNKDTLYGPSELYEMLTAAGIGTFITRSLWVSGIIAAMDSNKDGSISLAEFLAVRTSPLMENTNMEKEELVKKLEAIKAQVTKGGNQAGPLVDLLTQLIQMALQNPAAVLAFIKAIVDAFRPPTPA